jgi:peptide/nickel transport system ATP-binding protein
VSLLAVEHLEVRYGRGSRGLVAVDDVTFALEAGASLGIVGESGAGKSTIARAIAQIAPTSGGTITLDGRDVTNATGSALRHVRACAQMVFQDPFSTLHPRQTVGVTLREAVRLRERREAGLPDQGADDDDAPAGGDDAVAELLDQVTLGRAMADRYPHELSGGQLQRVGIARALAGRPRLLILDEVTSALDVSVQAAVLNLLRELRESLGLTYLCISHDLAVIGYLCEEVMVMYLGQAVERASWGQLVRTPRHPYSRTLLDSIPHVHGDPVSAPVGGSVPDARNPPPGCRFHPRCPAGPAYLPSRTRCVAEDPQPAMAGSQRAFACHYPLPADDESAPAEPSASAI